MKILSWKSFDGFRLKVFPSGGHAVPVGVLIIFHGYRSTPLIWAPPFDIIIPRDFM